MSGSPKPLKPLTRWRERTIRFRSLLFVPERMTVVGRLAFLGLLALNLGLAGQSLTENHRIDHKVDHRFAVQQQQAEALRAMRDRQIADTNLRVQADVCAIMPLIGDGTDPRVRRLSADLRCPPPVSPH
jgi:hypothetical protein